MSPVASRLSWTSRTPTVLFLVLLMSLVVLPRAWAQIFTPTGDLNIARSGQQATLLPDGRVLASGGYDNLINGIAQAEIFDPLTGAWTVTGANVIARMEHTATLLQDGRVLVVGGVSSNSSCSSNATAETYNPVSSTWSLTGNLPAPAGAGATAVRLIDGRVLVSGGGNRCGGIFNTAALFDPITNTWSATANMTTTRAFHSAVLLSDGRVLVAGGVPVPNTWSASAEVYDPIAGTWTAVGSMLTARGTDNNYVQTFLAVLQSDGVLAAGELMAGNVPTANVEVFSLGSASWTATGTLNTPRAFTTSTTLTNGMVLVAGGFVPSIPGLSAASSAELFDPATGVWSLTGSLNTARGVHTATLLTNGDVLIAGGTPKSSTTTSSAEIYHPGPTRRSTSTSLSCTPSTVPVNSSTFCTATVSDTAGVGPITPSGTVDFTSSRAGTFSAASCTLAPVTVSSASCSLTYTPNVVAAHTVMADYTGDSTHLTSSGAGTVTTTIRSSSTSVSCGPSTLQQGMSTTCTATVSDISGTGETTPTGTVTFASNQPGTFSSTTCTVSAGQCSVTYMPGAAGAHTITASYAGDEMHTPSSGNTSISQSSSGTTGITLDGNVHGSQDNGTTTASTVVVGPIGTPTAGDTIVCEFVFDASSTFINVADNVNSGVYLPAVFLHTAWSMGPASRYGIYYKENVAAANTTITLAYSPANTRGAMSCQAWKGTPPAFALDSTFIQAQDGTTANPATGANLIPFADGRLVIGALGTQAVTAAAGAGYTPIDFNSLTRLFPEYQIQATKTATAAGYAADADTWYDQMVAFAPNTGGFCDSAVIMDWTGGTNGATATVANLTASTRGGRTQPGSDVTSGWSLWGPGDGLTYSTSAYRPFVRGLGCPFYSGTGSGGLGLKYSPTGGPLAALYNFETSSPTVSAGACFRTDLPNNDTGGATDLFSIFANTDNGRRDFATAAMWGDGSTLTIYLEVQDLDNPNAGSVPIISGRDYWLDLRYVKGGNHSVTVYDGCGLSQTLVGTVSHPATLDGSLASYLIVGSGGALTATPGYNFYYGAIKLDYLYGKPLLP